MRTMTLRTSDEQGELLDLVARVQGRTRVAVVREALERYLRAEVAEGMRERVRARHAAERATYDRLAR